MNYKNLILILLILATLFAVACSSDNEVPLAGDLEPSGGKVSLSIINPNADNLTNETGQENEEPSDNIDGSGIPEE